MKKDREKSPADQLAEAILGTTHTFENMAMWAVIALLVVVAVIFAYLVVIWVIAHWQVAAITAGYVTIVTAHAIWEGN